MVAGIMMNMHWAGSKVGGVLSNIGELDGSMDVGHANGCGVGHVENPDIFLS